MDSDLLSYNKYHFVGVGGVSMVALCQILASMGKKLTGSDISSDNFELLNSVGVETKLGHDKHNITSPDVVVYNKAIPYNNVELVEARARDILCVDRADILGEVSKIHKKTIAISGTHGKTTTTAMVSSILMRANKYPSIHVGGRWDKIDGYGKLGAPEYFVTEACEYKESFLTLHPYITVITNVESEHLDYYKTRQNLNNAFIKFCTQSKKVICSYRLRDELNIDAITFGADRECDYRATSICSVAGKYSFTLYVRGKRIGRIDLGVEGKYNVYNALAAIAVCMEEGILFKCIKGGLREFQNVDRRFQKLYDDGEQVVLQDYAHHPTEISNCLKTCVEVYGHVTCVFQPHTYSRTRYLLDSFSTCFEPADKLYILPTYASREKYDELGSIYKLKDAVEQNTDVEIIENKTLGIINANCVVFIGAGDIEKTAEEYVNRLKLSKNAKKVLTNSHKYSTLQRH